MASAVNPLTGSTPSAGVPTSSSSASTGGVPAPSEEMFLKLLVAQLQNQDPLNPMDSTTFVTQLAQFSELEQVMAIRGDADTLVTDQSSASSASSSAQQQATPSSTSSTPSTAQTQP